jgi:hypothetical protein
MEVLSLVVSVVSMGVGLGYAMYTNYRAKKAEAITQLALRQAISSVEHIKRDTTRAYSHLDPLRDYLWAASPAPKAMSAVNSLTYLYVDVGAADRRLDLLREELMAVQGMLPGRTPEAHTMISASRNLPEAKTPDAA